VIAPVSTLLWLETPSFGVEVLEHLLDIGNGQRTDDGM
jgi:hypothetical protein